MLIHSMEELIGHTPLMRLHRIEEELSLPGVLLAKLEGFSASGSAKDRAARAMLDHAKELKKGATLIEPTSGNTGIALAALAAARGYTLILTMPDTMSVERRRLLSAYGATVVLTDGKEGMRGAIQKAEELHAQIPNSFIPSQFDNPFNPQSHFETTGPEIWQDTQGQLDAFIAGIGTGGTISGTGAYLKAQKPQIQVIGVEPASSPLLTRGKSGPHGLQGIGANFVPENLNQTVVDRILPVTEEEAYRLSRLMATKEGLLVGITSGAALAAAAALFQEEAFKGKTIVSFLPDSGDKYLSTPLFAQG